MAATGREGRCPKTRYRAGFGYASRWEAANLAPVYQQAITELLKLQGDRFVAVRVTPSAEAGCCPGTPSVDGNAAPIVTTKRGLSRAPGGWKSSWRNSLRVACWRSASHAGQPTVPIWSIWKRIWRRLRLSGGHDRQRRTDAYADGKAVYVTTGMLRFATTDLELQTVVAHELAHHTERHMDKTGGTCFSAVCWVP